MVIKGARDPLAMGDDNYGRLCLELKFFLADTSSLPHRPTHMVALQLAKADAFVAAIDAMNFSQNAMRESTKNVEKAFTPLDAKLRWMRNILPTLTPGDKSILIPFGLDKAVSKTYEELKNDADAADAYWQTVKLEPLYAPVADGCNELTGLVADFEVKRMAQVAAVTNYSVAQNAKDLARAAHHTDERAIFGHYAAYYPDGQDLYWDQTPWGRAVSGESGGTSGEIRVPENLVATLEGEDVRIAWDAVADADEYQLVHTQHPPMFLEIYAGEDTGFLHLKPDNGTHYYNVRAKRGDEYGAYGTPVSVEVVVAPPAPPVNLSIVQVGSDTKITWEAPPGVFYDGCSLFVADAPTGGGTPPLPAEPMFHDLFVYSLTLSAPAPGMTRFVWVTGVKNGATSDPAGPASVDIV